MSDPRPLPLEGTVVIDLGQIYNGPYCTFLLSMAGARVIKIEPRDGEHLRRRGVVGGAALPFAMINSNKDCITLNLKTERGRELLIDLVRRGDVLVENFAPGAMERLGVGPERLMRENPRLIYAGSSGYGTVGPYRDYPAMDLTVQAMSGIMSITGFPDRPPVKAGPALCDFFAGVHLYAAIVTALVERERSGKGRVVEATMLESVYCSLSSSLGMWWGSHGKAPSRTGNRHGGMAESPYNVYPTKDGYIAIICVGEVHWRNLVKVMGRPELAEHPHFATLKARVANIDTVDEIVTAFTKQFDRQELFELLIGNRVSCAPVRTLDEVANDPHLHARGSLQWIDHPEYGRIVLPHSPLRFEGSQLKEIEPSGRLGAANQEIFGDWLGLGAKELEQLKRDEVI